MKTKLTGLVLAMALGAALAVNAGPGQGQEQRPPIRRAKLPKAANSSAPVKPMGAILVPGNPLRFDISWVDQASGRYFLAEGGNAAVDVFDAENNFYLGRIGGFHGVGTADDPCGAIEGMGPSGIVVTPDNHLWADDAHGTVKVFDLAGAQPPFNNLAPIATISTGAGCRADEIGYDPQDHVIVAGNPAEKPPYASVISANAPYEVLSKITFPDARGLEQPLWDPGLKGGRMLVTVPGDGVVVLNLKDPKKPVVEATYQTPNCSSGLALGPAQHLLVGCGGGKPLIIINALDGKIITTVADTHGADEVWYNAGDNRFYASSGGAMPLLAAIDAQTGVLVNNSPAGPGVHSVAAYAGNNHVFVPVAIPAANSPGDACATLFGLAAKQGCIIVYAHEK
jgi:hypothetical protein